MAENVTVARPYAEAAFRLARDQGRLAAWSETLASMAAVAANDAVAACIANPNVPVANKIELVSAAAKVGAGDTANFLTIVAENNRLALLPEIAAFFETLKGAEEGTRDAVVFSAFPLDDAQRQKLVAELEAHFKTKLNPDIQLDPELIGGVKVVVGDQVLDASVRGKLAAMATALRN